MKQLEYKWAIDSPVKQLDYNWGVIVGLLLLGAAVGAASPVFGLTENALLLDSLILHISLAILFIISGIAVWWVKAFGWYLYFGLIACFILVCAYGALRVLVLTIFVPGEFSFSSSMFISWFSPPLLASLFLYLQIRYWRRRAPLYKRNKRAV